jgi:uncharacterized protein YjeT (DUF2065 family)
MVRSLFCPNCHSPYEAGDRFCQDCGLHLHAQRSMNQTAPGTAYYTYFGEDTYGAFEGITATRPRRVLNWDSLKLSNVPAEVILLAAALAYIVSALAWCNYDQLWKSAVRTAADIPHALARFSPAALMALGGQPTKDGATAADGKPVAGSEVKSLLAQCAQGAKKAPAASPKRQPLIAKTAAPPVVHPKPLGVSAQAAAAPATTMQKQSAIALDPTEIIIGQSEAKRIAAAPAMPPSKVSNQQLEDLSQYNQKLSDYFMRSGGNLESAGSAPTFKEWVEGGKQPF